MTASITKTAHWIKLKSLPIGFTNESIIHFNISDFLLAPHAYNKEVAGDDKIFKYNANCDKLDAYFECPQDLRSESRSMAYDEIKHKLYVYGTSMTVLIIDIATKQFEIIKNIYGIPDNPNLLSIEGRIHLIGGDESSKHLIWSDDNKSFKEIHHFQEFSEIHYGSTLYISSKNIIVLIGGTGIDKNIHQRVNIGIWIFCLKKKKWRQIKKECPWKLAKAIITSDEKYIIIKAADDYDRGNDIFILEIKEDTMILRKSIICCPKEGIHPIVRTGDSLKYEMLVIGFIKHLFKSNDFIHLTLPPYSIMQLIAKWYNMESIHWLEWNVVGEENEHYVIGINKILSFIDLNVKPEIVNLK